MLLLPVEPGTMRRRGARLGSPVEFRQFYLIGTSGHSPGARGESLVAISGIRVGELQNQSLMSLTASLSQHTRRCRSCNYSSPSVNLVASSSEHQTSWAHIIGYKMFPVPTRPVLPVAPRFVLLLLLFATITTIMLLTPLIIAICAGLLPACIAQQAELSYTVSSGFPTSLFSSYYIEPAPTQEVLTFELL